MWEPHALWPTNGDGRHVRGRACVLHRQWVALQQRPGRAVESCWSIILLRRIRPAQKGAKNETVCLTLSFSPLAKSPRSRDACYSCGVPLAACLLLPPSNQLDSHLRIYCRRGVAFDGDRPVRSGLEAQHEVRTNNNKEIIMNR